MKYFFPLSILTLLLLFSCSTESTPIYQLDVSVDPTEAGSISPEQGEYEEGESVEITATPNQHWVFDSWQGDHTGGSNPASLTMNEDKDITALFIKREYPLAIEIEGKGAVSEEVVQPKATDYPHGTTVELTANPADGWEFVEWQGDLEGGENPELITVDDEQSVTAVFTEAVYSIETTVEGEGEIRIEPQKAEYEYGDEVKITVEPDDGWSFVHWDGDIEGAENPIETTVKGNITVTAVLDNSPFAGGNGSETYPYQVSTVEQLQAIVDYIDAHFIQINDIDASDTEIWNGGKGFRPIGDQIIPFEGSYDGNQKSINGLYIDNEGASDTGLFGWVESSKFQNIFLIDINVNGGGIRSAGLVGRLTDSVISNCHVTGTIKNVSLNSGGLVGDLVNQSIIKNSSAHVEIYGNSQFGILVGNANSGTQIINSTAEGSAIGSNNYSSYIGGLVGVNRGNIEASFSKAIVEGENKIGGLVGQLGRNGNVTNSYTQSEVEGNEEVGGLIGIVRDNATVKNSYSVSTVLGTLDVGGLIGLNGNEVEGSYWNPDKTSQSDGVGRGNSDGTTKLSTSQMSGTAPIENMPEFDWDEVWKTTSDYPILRWQED